MADVPGASAPAGILPRVVRQLVQKRRAVKDLMAKETNPGKITDYNIRQQALKLTVNSMCVLCLFCVSVSYERIERLT